MSEVNDPNGWPNVDDEHVVLLDVRIHLESGREPFPAIMTAVARLEPWQVLYLRAPFEPVPLYSVMAAKGYACMCRKVGGGTGGECWEVLFYKKEGDKDSSTATAGVSAECVSGEEGLFQIDLRGMEPPEPTERLLNTLEGMRYDDVLLVRDDRGPERFIPLFTERGYSHRAEQDGENDWTIRIWRNR